MDEDDSEKTSWTIWKGADENRWGNCRNLAWLGYNLERAGFWEWQSGNIFWRSGVDREPGLVQRFVAWPAPPHAEENTEVIDEAGIRAIACDWGTGRDWWRTFRMCLWDCSSARHNRLAQSTSSTQKSCTDVFYRRVRGFNKQGVSFCHDVDKFVIGSMLDFKEQSRNSFTSDQSVCWTQRRTTKDECCVVCSEHWPTRMI